MTLSGIADGTSVVKTVLYGNDIYSKVSVDLATGAVSGTEIGDLACTESVALTSGKMSARVYAAILPAKDFNVVAKNDLSKCYKYSNTLASAIPVGKFSRVSDKTATALHVFSLNGSGKTAVFAPGNLQYVTGTGYRFAANQWTVLRGTSGNIKNSAYADGDVIDLFSWSTATVEGVNGMMISCDNTTVSVNSPDPTANFDYSSNNYFVGYMLNFSAGQIVSNHRSNMSEGASVRLAHVL